MLLSPTLVACLLFLLHFHEANATCYCKDFGEIVICGGNGQTTCENASSVDSEAQLCCGIGDQCGIDSLCHFTTPQALSSGYYLGGCTDPTFTDPVCSNPCGEFPFVFPVRIFA
jgi:hypothetical protein